MMSSKIIMKRWTVRTLKIDWTHKVQTKLVIAIKEVVVVAIRHGE